MSHRGVKDLRRRLWEADQRRVGREDARAGRPANMADQHYQRGYREGSRPCQCATVAAHPDGCDRQPEKGSLCEYCKAGHNETEEA